MERDPVRRCPVGRAHAIGLLATGVVAGSLLLVVISIGVALLAFLLLIGVVISYRHEIFSRRPPQAVAQTPQQELAAAAAAAPVAAARAPAASAAKAARQPELTKPPAKARADQAMPDERPAQAAAREPAATRDSDAGAVLPPGLSRPCPESPLRSVSRGERESGQREPAVPREGAIPGQQAARSEQISESATAAAREDHAPRPARRAVTVTGWQPSTARRAWTGPARIGPARAGPTPNGRLSGTRPSHSGHPGLSANRPGPR